ncbi:MAG TPA: MFS transporter [Planctomycetota bacterium]|nr:MFS transporter [Planctomycetota bacterium]
MLHEYLRQVAAFSRPARLFLAAQFLYGIGQAAVWVLRNLYLKSAGHGESFIGYTLAVQSLGMASVVLTLPLLMDRHRLRPFLVAGAFLLAASLAGVVWVRGERAILACCFGSGVGIALLEVGTAPFFSRHSGGGERPFLFGFSTALSPTAGLLATLGLKAGEFAWGENPASHARMLLTAAGFTAASMAVLALIRESAPEPAEAGGDRFDWRTASRFFLPELAFGLGAGLTIPFINLYFRNRFGLSAGTIGLTYSAAQALMMVAFLAAPLLARRFGAVRTIVVFQLSSIPFFLALAFTVSLPVAIAAFVLRHACMNMVHPVGSHFAMEVVHPRQRARVNGLKQAANKVSWVVANSLGGVLIVSPPLFGRDGFATTMGITIVLYIVGSALYWRFFSKEPAGRVAAPEVEPTVER